MILCYFIIIIIIITIYRPFIASMPRNSIIFLHFWFAVVSIIMFK